jgi:hypothetical protein
MHYMSIVFHEFVYRCCFWNLFASIFSTSVGTNYLDHSIGVLSHNPFVSLFIREDFGSKLSKPPFWREFFMCTSYDHNILSYIYYATTVKLYQLLRWYCETVGLPSYQHSLLPLDSIPSRNMTWLLWNCTYYCAGR